MALTEATVRKFFREIFGGQQPLVVDPQQRYAVGLEILEPVRGRQLVTIDSEAYVRAEHKDTQLCQFSIEDPSAPQYYWRQSSFCLRLDEGNRVKIFYGKDLSAFVSDLAEIATLVAACQERMLRRKSQKSKRDKVQSLKAQAVVARVKQLAREEKFDFYTDTNQRALKLFVKLSEQECAELEVPFKDFEAVIPHLRGAIQSLRGFHSLRLRLAIRQLGGYSRRDWVRHESLL